MSWVSRYPLFADNPLTAHFGRDSPEVYADTACGLICVGAVADAHLTVVHYLALIQMICCRVCALTES